MINFFVDTKCEYTTHLVNVLTPLIYEGLQSIYTEALKVSNNEDNVLKVFQSFLRRIPKWSGEIIKQESDRIMNNSKSFSWLPDLVKATIKANMVVLSYNPSLRVQNKIDPKVYQDLKIEDFIHKIYIECARELINYPYLMYHQYPPIEFKRNQRETNMLIKDSIKEAVRKLLPIKQLLEFYLGVDLEQNIGNDNFDRNISEAEERNILKLIKRDLSDNNYPAELRNQSNLQNGGNREEPKDLQSKILDIIHKESTPKSDFNPHKNLTADIHTPNFANRLDTPMTKATRSLTTSSSTESIKNKNDNFDDKIKNVLEKQLGEVDLETSLSYRPETNDKDYQEIFANASNVEHQKNQSAGGNSIKEKDTIKNKKKFFTQYLNM